MAGVSLISPLTDSRIGASTPADEVNARLATIAKWNVVIGELLRMRALADDWDGKGASAPKAENVDTAIIVVQRMQAYASAIPPSQAVPGVSGEVLLVWQNEGLFLEAEICSADQIEWMSSANGQPTRHWTTDAAVPCFVGRAS